uniref:Uncharacterized protein n=1 Tax=Trypanosoma vivax (strain Y486) TaxID=1055687 RepID=G0U7K0_TRYVY|nr:hypothetical protein TVY486_1009030 [Trypanosoma vivax Y486]
MPSLTSNPCLSTYQHFPVLLFAHGNGTRGSVKRGDEVAWCIFPHFVSCCCWWCFYFIFTFFCVLFRSHCPCTSAAYSSSHVHMAIGFRVRHADTTNRTTMTPRVTAKECTHIKCCSSLSLSLSALIFFPYLTSSTFLTLPIKRTRSSVSVSHCVSSDFLRKSEKASRRGTRQKCVATSRLVCHSLRSLGQ